MKTVNLHRKDEFVNVWRDYQIYIDNKKYGQIKNGETLVLKLNDNIENLQLKIDWCGSKSFSLIGKDYHTVSVKVNTNLYYSIFSFAIAMILVMLKIQFSIFFLIISMLLMFYFLTIGRLSYLKLIEV
jgi:hypothetical protein